MSEKDFSSRADPDVLLSAIAKKTKRRGGRLFLFIGMAPGVGKTYAMLAAARDAKRNDSDIVVGVVETHGRKETEILLEGLEIIPKKELLHRGISFYEMDIDRILERKPHIVLVDELAHTNIPGSRHAKRWQDVLELLDAGIDVFSTLNVQHLESRKDAVEAIAKIAIFETVPDSVLDRAYQIRLIDLSVPELLRRLKEGKVYLGDKAELAAANFFKEEKLTALREIALRLVAERVDAELQTFVAEREVGTFWPAMDRLMVAIGYSHSEKVIRATRRMAYNLDAPWVAVHISTTDLISDQKKATLMKNLELARNLGAEIITVTDTNVVDALIRIARQRDVTQIVMGRPTKNWFKVVFGQGSLFDQLTKKCSIDICVVGDRDKKGPRELFSFAGLKMRSTALSFAKAFLFTAALTGLNSLLALLVGYRAVGFIFLLGMLILGLFVPLGALIFAAFITMAAWNFFFIPPIGTFHISYPDDIYLCISYLAVALATGILTRRNRYQQNILVSREKRAETIALMTQAVCREKTLKAIIDSVTNKVADFLNGACDVALVKKDRSLSSFAKQNLKFTNITREMAVAKWVADNNKAAGKFTETLTSADALYIPIKGTFDMVGVLAYQPQKPQKLSIEDIDFLFTAARQLAVSLERENFRKRALDAERLSESERLHQILLNLLIANVKTRISKDDQLTFIMDNYLVMSRLLMGMFPLKKEPCDLAQLFGLARSKVGFELSNRIININTDANLPSLKLERDLIIQALANILLNAAQHSLKDQEIDVDIRHNDREVLLAVKDRGMGVDEQDLGRIFEKFHRGANSQGAGLGLAIVKGIIKAHGGKIAASNRSGGGLAVMIILPRIIKHSDSPTLTSIP